jgi:hypothetical protein
LNKRALILAPLAPSYASCPLFRPPGWLICPTKAGEHSPSAAQCSFLHPLTQETRSAYILLTLAQGHLSLRACIQICHGPVSPTPYYSLPLEWLSYERLSTPPGSLVRSSNVQFDTPPATPPTLLPALNQALGALPFQVCLINRFYPICPEA